MEDEEKKGHISDFEWQFVLAVAIFIDTIQFIIEWFDFIAIGLIINRFVSIGTALLLIFYLLYRRAHMDIRAWLSVLFATGGELIPIVSAFPLFSLDIAYIWSLNSKSILAKTAGMATGSKLTKGLQKLPPGAKPPVIRRPQAGPGAVPPRIGASGRPMAQPGATPPVIQRPQATPGAIPPKISDVKSPPSS